MKQFIIIFVSKKTKYNDNFNIDIFSLPERDRTYTLKGICQLGKVSPGWLG
jgi:hypothetical protein